MSSPKNSGKCAYCHHNLHGKVICLPGKKGNSCPGCFHQHHPGTTPMPAGSQSGTHNNTNGVIHINFNSLPPTKAINLKGKK